MKRTLYAALGMVTWKLGKRYMRRRVARRAPLAPALTPRGRGRCAIVPGRSQDREH